MLGFRPEHVPSDRSACENCRARPRIIFRIAKDIPAQSLKDANPTNRLTLSFRPFQHLTNSAALGRGSDQGLRRIVLRNRHVSNRAICRAKWPHPVGGACATTDNIPLE